MMLIETKKIMCLLLLPLLCCIIFPFETSSALLSKTNVSSQGNIVYNTIESAPIYYGTNLADIPDDWDLTYGSEPYLYFLDYNFVRTKDKPSIRSDVPHVDGVDVNVCRECDGIRLWSVNPGDHIYFSVWIYCEDSPDGYDESDIYNGGMIGMDFYIINKTEGVRGVPYALPRGSEMHAAHVVKWGTKTWTQLSYDIVVPTDYFTRVATGNWPLYYGDCSPNQITHVIPWLTVRPEEANGTVWFADAEFYINPSTVSIPS
jgi:hypothetical protein